MIFKIFSLKKAFLTPNKAKVFTNLIITLVFEKTPIIAENCDLNIDPCKKNNFVEDLVRAA
jgi:hypothetical protein